VPELSPEEHTSIRDAKRDLVLIIGIEEKPRTCSSSCRASQRYIQTAGWSDRMCGETMAQVRGRSATRLTVRAQRAFMSRPTFQKGRRSGSPRSGAALRPGTALRAISYSRRPTSARRK
jgi:hypothetical protein